jgi:NAD(P)-dependent dehydrogenase (short-subunit alcohol dehydrogenase family)
MSKVSDTPRVVVVTGASGGIGRATAKLFAEGGSAVALLARGSEGLDGARAEVEALGGTAATYAVDVSDAQALEKAAAQIEEDLGEIDVWVNVAFTSVFAPFIEIEAEEFARVTAVTYLGFVNGTRSALRRMLPRDRGTIVQVGSTLAYRGIPLQSAYCGAKHATQGFHESLRTELLHTKSGVRTTMVQMPAVNTPQFSWVLSRLPHQAQPVPPIYQPEVAARAVVYGDPPGQCRGSGPARPLPRADRLLLPADGYAEAPGPAGEPVEPGGRAGRPRLRHARDLRRPLTRALRAGMGLSAPSGGGRGGRSRGPGRCRGPPPCRAKPPMMTATALRLGLGSALLAAPGPALVLAGGPDRHDDRVRRLSRVLGGRLVLQGVADAVLDGRSRRLDMTVELGHAASMLPVVALSPRHRRTASVSAALATGLLLVDLYAGRRGGPPKRRRAPLEADRRGHWWS